jgi:lysyl-tRNA synthetase, class I
MNPTTYLNAKAWPMVEALALLERIKKTGNPKGYVLFETGYGPSGLPHIGTFGEVARTQMVRHAFQQISDIPTRLICFSDDRDGLRKVPDNLPQPEMLAANLGKPLTSVPDPFGTHESFGHHMNARLRAFLDTFGFDYEFKSSTETYQSGEFDAALLRILENYDRVMNIMMPTLGEERQQTYSPFLPVSPRSGKVLLAKVLERNAQKGTIIYEEEDGSREEIPVTGGHCKLQWKPDMGMRWAALGVDYEMYGKDHLVSAQLYDAICKVAGGTPPQQMMFELFLDEKGQKISKSKGNGITIDEWLTYAPTESLALYMFTSPRKAKKLYFDVIPQQVDDYLTHLEKYAASYSPPEGESKHASVSVGGQSTQNTPHDSAEAESAAPREGSLSAACIENPVWHIHGGKPPTPESAIRFSMLLNLVSAGNAQNADVLWGYIHREFPAASPATHPMLGRLVECAIRYYHDFIKPSKKFRAPTELERVALSELREYLVTLTYSPPEGESKRASVSVGGQSGNITPHDSAEAESAPPQGGSEMSLAETMQTKIYDIGMAHYSKETLREWFKAMYEVLLGASQGPRMGNFIALFGVAETIALIDGALSETKPSPSPRERVG